MNRLSSILLLIALALASPLLARETTRSTPGSLDDLLLSESFETVANGDLPTGWQQVDRDGGYCSWFQRTSTWEVFSRDYFSAHGGIRFAMCHYNDGGAPNDDWLILPQQMGGRIQSLSYWVAAQDSLFPESFEVRVSTTGSQPADFSNVVFADTAVTVEWRQHIHDLSDFAGSPIWIAFHYNSANRFALKLDDVEIDGIPPHTGTIAGQVTDNSLLPVDNAIIRITALNQETRSAIGGSYALSGLLAGTYDVQVIREFYYPTTFPGVQVNPPDTTRLDANLTPRSLVFRDWVSGAPPRAIHDLDTLLYPLWATIDPLAIYDLDVTISIEHPYIGDLDVWLQSPALNRVQLMARDPFNDSQNVTNARFDDEAERPFTAGQAPYTGTWRPVHPLSALIGDSTRVIRNGVPQTIWWLVVYDGSPLDEGRVTGMTLHVAAPLTSAIRGRVTDSQTGLPLSNVAVTVSSPAPIFTAHTDTTGNYVVPAPLGLSSIRFGVTGYFPYADSNYTIAAGDTLAMDAVLLRDLAASDLKPVATRFGLEPNYPNPFNSTTTFQFVLQRAGHVELILYDLLGRDVATVVNGDLVSGEHRISFRADHLASGIYFVRLRSGSETATGKIMLLK
jgi:hypothetical protein